MLSKKIPVLFALITLILILVPGSIARGEGSLPVLVGMYPSAELYQTVGEIKALDIYFEAPTVALAGTFLDLESPNWLIIAELDAAWGNGYVPFVNLGAGTAGTSRTAQQIADGEIDTAIRNWAAVYASWSQDNTKRAFIAPLQEMNGDWVSYYGDPANFIRAYLRIQQIFKEEGVSGASISWVFAPNGWNHPNRPQDSFESYYPGHSAVDVVGFSSFNFGDCWSYTNNETYEQIYKPFLDRMAAMAPGKPIFIAEIGSVAYGVNRAAWFTDTLSKLGAYPGVRAILYFNRSEYLNNDQLTPACKPEVDYSLDASSGEGKDAFKSQVTQHPYGYWSPDSIEMIDIAFGRPIATFEDVWPASAFSGKTTTAYYQPWIERLVSAGITGGCASNTVDFSGVTDFTYRYYCPENGVTRAQMAVFLERGIHYPDAYSPPSVPITFIDTSGHWANLWIEALRSDGITGGCGIDLYCPENEVTRAQMAVFLLRSKYGAGYAPLPAAGTIFGDVPSSHWAAAWIEQLFAVGITGGCGGGNYCPDVPVNRGQMAIFLVRTFNLP